MNLPFRYVAIASVLFGSLAAFAFALQLRPPHPDARLPSCFDEIAKAAARPGERCSPVN